MIAKCPHCKSIWVCWNWEHGDDGSWGHECWDCSNVCSTPRKIWNGLPHRILYRQKFFDPKYKRKMMFYRFEE